MVVFTVGLTVGLMALWDSSDILHLNGQVLVTLGLLLDGLGELRGATPILRRHRSARKHWVNEEEVLVFTVNNAGFPHCFSQERPMAAIAI